MMKPQHVKYLGTTDDQVKWGSNDDPRGLLVEGDSYTLIRVEIHSWHTKYELLEFPGKQFNSVSFSEPVDDIYEKGQAAS